jgi:hypothetical protein
MSYKRRANDCVVVLVSVRQDDVRARLTSNVKGFLRVLAEALDPGKLGEGSDSREDRGRRHYATTVSS